MNFKTKILLLVLFVIQVSEITSTQTSRTSTKKYDITRYINKTIIKLFNSVKTIIVTNLLKRIKNDEPKTYKYKLSSETKEIRNKIVIRNITINEVNFHDCYNSKRHINYEFFNNKIQIEFDRAVINYCGDIQVSKDEYDDNVVIRMEFNDPCFMTVIKSSAEIELDKPFEIDLQCSNWNSNDYRINMTGNREVVNEIKSRLPSLLLNNMKHNQILLKALNKSYGFQPKKHIIAKRRDFLDNEQQYYFRIFNIPYFCFTLRNVTIRGLTNFHSLKYHELAQTIGNTLLIKDIRGNITLDYGQESEPNLEMDFYIDWLSISMDKFTGKTGRGLKVSGHWCSITRTEDNTRLTSVQAEGIIRAIESALASSIMPRMQVWKFNEMETLMGEKCSEISSSSSNWELLKESFKKWIPFNHDHIDS